MRHLLLAVTLVPLIACDAEDEGATDARVVDNARPDAAVAPIGGGYGGDGGDGLPVDRDDDSVVDEGAGGAGPEEGGAPEQEWCADASADDACGDGFDDDCDGRVDEGCTCTVPEKPCYPGDPADLEVPDAACQAGVQACRLEFYGECEGAITPAPEVCDGIDNDCNGAVDDLDDCANTPPEAICPPDQTGSPLARYVFEGGYADADDDPMARATWTLIEAPGGSTSTPAPADQLRTEIFADLQGEYALQLEVEDDQGGIGRCTTRLSTSSADQLRIEMVWNVNARGDMSDVDMHLKRSPDALWFDAGPGGDDCFFRNCRVCSGGSEAECRAEIADYNNDPNRSPPPQVEWTPPLDGDDPRLDLDDVEGSGPENINILTPRAGTYRLGVHYWDADGFGPSTVSVRIFCANELAREFAPTILQPTGDFGDPATEFWELADITWRDGTCIVSELGPAGCPRICTRGEAESGGCAEGFSRGEACP